MPKKDSTGWELSHWAGPPAQLVEAARLAVAKVTALAPYPEGYDPDDRDRSYDSANHRAWLAAETAAELSISVREKDGYNSELAGIDELAELPERSFESITSIVVEVGAGGYSPPGVSIRVSRDAGLSVEIHGYERSWTAGLRHQLEDILRPEHRAHPPLMRTGAHAFFIALALSQLVFYGALVVTALSDAARSTRVAISLGGMTAVLLLVALVWYASARRFQLLHPAEEPRYQRWRSKLLFAVLTVTLGVIGSLIASAVL